jgi:hypothetical protein
MRSLRSSTASLLCIVLAFASLLPAGCGRSDAGNTKYFVAAAGGVGRIILATSDSDRQVRIKLPGCGAISSVTVFKGNLVLGCVRHVVALDRPDPGQGLWLLSLSDGQVRRCKEAELPGPVKMSAVLDDTLWFLEGSRLWSTRDLEQFELRQENIRAAFVTSTSSLVLQRRDGSLFWMKIADSSLEQGEFDKTFGNSLMESMFGDYAFDSTGGTLHLPVPGTESNKMLFYPARDLDWGFSAFFDTRHNDWISMRNSITLIHSVCHVRTSNDTKDAFTVRINRIVHAIQVSQHEFETITKITSSWQMK